MPDREISLFVSLGCTAISSPGPISPSPVSTSLELCFKPSDRRLKPLDHQQLVLDRHRALRLVKSAEHEIDDLVGDLVRAEIALAAQVGPGAMLDAAIDHVADQPQLEP